MEEILARKAPCPLAQSTLGVLSKSPIVLALMQEAEGVVRESLPAGAPADAAAEQCVQYLLGAEHLVEYEVPAARPR